MKYEQTESNSVETGQYIMPKSVINVIHHINKLKEEKYMIILVSAEKNIWWKNSTYILIKNAN